ncbi:hypothetical protein LVJ94_04105 [Pendulispora rubella]|uniref:Outer membrane protein beta-barrel domain-containing protein n=1 Tax=Pendulispora rubella TaxID=2741070 RepID=A0ABZ2L658_9BACT
MTLLCSASKDVSKGNKESLFMRRTILGLGMVAGALLASSTAYAQGKTDLGQKGQFILSADRLLPVVSYESVKTDTNGGSTTESSARMSLLTANFSHRSVFDVPRASLDYAIIDHLTIGGSVFVAFDVSHSRTNKGGNLTQDVDLSKESFFGFAPRVGYVLPLSASVAFWPRGGFSYIRRNFQSPDSSDADLSASVDQFALDLEPMFVLSPVPHFGITVGANIDIPVTGKNKTDVRNGNTTTSVSFDSTQFYLGATAGILGYF